SLAGSNVKRLSTPRASSSNQTSLFPLTDRVSATRPPSGDKEGLAEVALSRFPTLSISLPERSNHTNCVCALADLIRYAIGPAADADNTGLPSTATCSAPGVASPARAHGPISKGCATSV